MPHADEMNFKYFIKIFFKIIFFTLKFKKLKIREKLKKRLRNYSLFKNPHGV